MTGVLRAVKWNLPSTLLLWLLLAFQGGSPPAIGVKPLVLFFIRTDCPIAARYAPEFERLFTVFHTQGIDFRLVYVERNLTAAQIDAHRREYSLSIPAVPDPGRAYVRLAHARTTPEAAIFLHGTLVYHGRIDDRYLDFGKTRPSATRHDVEEVLTEIAAGRAVRPRENKAFGCAIGDLE